MWIEGGLYFIVLFLGALLLLICFGPPPDKQEQEGGEKEPLVLSKREGFKVKKASVDSFRKREGITVQPAANAERETETETEGEMEKEETAAAKPVDIELPDKLKQDMNPYLETVAKIKSQLQNMQKMELLLVAKETKELIDDINNKENELNKLL